jgi:hypothetical protein
VFYKKLLILLLPLTALLATINFTIDPAHLFSGGQYEKQMALILLKGENVTNVTNFDERLFQKFFISGLQKAPYNLVFGSSRAMLIDSSFLDNKFTINNCVSGGKIEDYIALYNLYRTKKMKPKHLYIGIDPWLFNENNPDNRWQSIDQDYQQMLKLLQPEQTESPIHFNSLLKWKEILSPSYFQTAIKSIPLKPLQKCKTKYNDGMTKLKDGAITYDKTTRDISPIEVNQKAFDFVKHNELDYIEDYRFLSKKNMDIFSQFIKYLKKEDIQITLILAPYHSIVYRYILSHPDYKSVLASEIKFREFAVENQVEIIGSFNPEKCKKIIDSDFIDGVHLKEEGIRKLIPSIYF